MLGMLKVTDDTPCCCFVTQESFLVVEEEGKIGMIQWRWYNCYVIMDGYIVLCCVLGNKSMKLKGKGEIGELLSRVKRLIS